MGEQFEYRPGTEDSEAQLIDFLEGLSESGLRQYAEKKIEFPNEDKLYFLVIDIRNHLPEFVQKYPGRNLQEIVRPFMTAYYERRALTGYDINLHDMDRSRDRLLSTINGQLGSGQKITDEQRTELTSWLNNMFVDNEYKEFARKILAVE